jgi:heme-degrading monooxygenase HmoA
LPPYRQKEERLLSMKTPGKPNGPVTLINMFSVEPEKQQALLDHLTRFSETIIRTFPGFISATFHASFDGKRITNVAQWESQDAFLAFLQSPEASEDRVACRELIISRDYNLYAVVGNFLAAVPQES